MATEFAQRTNNKTLLTVSLILLTISLFMLIMSITNQALFNLPNNSSQPNIEQLVRMFTSGGTLVLTLFGLLISLLALATTIFFKMFKEQVHEDIKQNVSEQVQKARKQILSSVRSSEASSSVTRGYVSYISYKALKDAEDIEIAKVMLKEALVITSIGFKTLIELAAHFDDIEDEKAEELKEKLLWAKCNLCFYYVEADIAGLSSNGEIRPPYLMLLENSDADSISSFAIKLRFNTDDEVNSLKNQHEYWHELKDSLLYCEYHFCRKKITEDPDYLKTFTDNVKSLLSSNSAKSDPDWLIKNREIWNDRLKELRLNANSYPQSQA